MESLSKRISRVTCTAVLTLTAFASSDAAHADTPSTFTAEITYVFQGWPVPNGYVITASNGFTAACNGLNEYSVSLPEAAIAICSISPIPDEFVATSEFEDDAMCGTKGMPVKAYRLSLTVPGAAMCSGTSRPSGYVTDRVLPSNQCLGNNVFVLKLLTEGVVACSMSRTPNGYVVTAGVPTANCTDAILVGDYWTFNQAHDGIQVCPFSPIPPGYYVVGAVKNLIAMAQRLAT